MTIALRRAAEIATRLGTDPWHIAEAEKISVIALPMPGSYRELYFNEPRSNIRAIIVDPDAGSAETRELLAHGLGHHFLHSGNRLRTHTPAWRLRAEREADDFAAALLIDGEILGRSLLCVDPPCEWELAEQFQVSESLIRRRVALMKNQSLLPA